MSDIFSNQTDYISPPPGFKRVPENESPGKFEAPDLFDKETPAGFEKLDNPIFQNLMPENPNARKMIDYMIGQAENPNEERAKIMNALYMSKRWGFDLKEAYDSQNEIIQWYTGKEKSPLEFAGVIGKGFEAGQYNVQIAKLRYKQYLNFLSSGEMNQNIEQQIVELKKKRPSYDVMKEAIPIQALTWAGEQIPTWISGAEKGLQYGVPMGLGGAAIAGIAGQAGPQVLVPEEAATVPGAFLALFSVGMTYGTMENIAQVEMGLAFDEMLEMEINPQIAGAAACGVGIINAGIEMVQLKGLLKPFKNAITKATSSIVRSGVLGRLAKNIASYGANVAKETLQEVAQESVNITFNELAKYWYNTANNKNIPHAEAEEIFERLKQTAYQSALSFGTLQLPGQISKTASGLITGRKESIQSGVESLETIPKEPTQSIEEEISPQQTKTNFEKQKERVGKLREKVTKTQQDIQENIEYYEKLLSEKPGKTLAADVNDDYKNFIHEIKEVKKEVDEVATELEAGNIIDISKHLEETDKRIQEQEKIAESIMPENKEGLIAVLKEWGSKDIGTGEVSRIWSSAIKKTSKDIEISDIHTVRLLKEIKNNPRKFQRLFAQVMGNDKVLKAIDTIEELETKEADMIAEAEGKAAIKATIALKDKIQEATRIAKRLEIAKEVTNPREKIAIITGKHTIGEILTDEKVEKAIKATPGTVKKALSEGRKQGIKKERARKKELTERANAKRKLKEYIRNLARKITRPPGRTIDFFYRKAIETIQSGIDPNFRQNKTLQARENLKQFLEKHPEAKEKISEKVLNTLDKKSLNDFTIKELEEIHTEVSKLKKQGRLKNILRKNQETRSFNKLKNKFIEIITRGEGVKKVKGKGKTTQKEGPGKKILAAHLNALRPMRMFDLFDGGKSFRGSIHDFFYNQANVITDDEYRSIDQRIKKVDQKQKELGVKASDLFKMREIDGIKYSVDEIMDIYVGMKNFLKREAILYGNNLGEIKAWQFIKTLTPAEKALADYIVQEYDDNYERLREAHIAYRNEDLGKEDFYSPIIRKDIDYEVLEVEIAQELTERANLKRAYAKRGFTKDRLKIAKRHQKEIQLGLVSTWLSQIHKQEHYIHGAQTIKNMQRMINDKDFAQALRQRFGREAVRLTKDYVNRVANPNIYKSFDSVSRVSRMLREHTAIAYLAFNAVTMFKQLPSIALYLPDAGPGHLVASAFKTALHPLKTVRMIERLDPQMKHRSLERFTEELKQADNNLYGRIIKQVGKTGMAGIYWMDKAATTIGWQAVYDRCIKQGMSEVEAAQEARNATLRTQPAAHAKDIAKIYATNEGFNWILMFSNQLNQIYNILTHDIPMQVKNMRFGQAISSLLSLGISGLLIWAISNRRLPEDKKDVKDALTDVALNAIPLVGKEITARRKGWTNTGIPGIQAIQAIGEIPIIKNDERRIEKSLELIAVALGLPYTGTRRVYKTLKEGNPMELIGGEAKE